METYTIVLDVEEPPSREDYPLNSEWDKIWDEAHKEYYKKVEAKALEQINKKVGADCKQIKNEKCKENNCNNDNIK